MYHFYLHTETRDKNAQKIIIELKTKLGSIEELDLSGEHGETKEVLEALESMGFIKKKHMLRSNN